VYPALHRLEADGRITAEWREVHGRRRKIYSVTKAGSDELCIQRVRWTEFSASITRVLGGATS
jgi:PadR family transcriptional regulator PadR